MLDMGRGKLPNAAQAIASAMTGSGNRWMEIRMLLSAWEWSQLTFPWWLVQFKSVLFPSPWPNHRPRLPEEPWCSLPSPKNKDGLGRKENNRFKRSLFYCSSHDYVHVFLISEKPHCICFFFPVLHRWNVWADLATGRFRWDKKEWGGKRLDSILQCFWFSWFSRLCSWKRINKTNANLLAKR